jgi:hypothetical protein
MRAAQPAAGQTVESSASSWRSPGNRRSPRWRVIALRAIRIQFDCPTWRFLAFQRQLPCQSWSFWNAEGLTRNRQRRPRGDPQQTRRIQDSCNATFTIPASQRSRVVIAVISSKIDAYLTDTNSNESRNMNESQNQDFVKADLGTGR